MSETNKCRCGRPTSGATLCAQCVKTLEVSIANVGSHHGDLDTLRTKQTRYGNAGATKGSVGKAQPLGMDHRFTTGQPGAQLDAETRNAVSTYCRMLMEEQPEASGPYCRHSCLHVSCGAIFRRRFPRDTVQSMCAYLLRQLRYIAAEEWADVMLADFIRLEQRLSRLLDSPPERWYAGKCSAPNDEDEDALCLAELYAFADKGEIVCPTCRAKHDVATRRAFLLNEAKGYNVTATEAAGALLAWTDYDGSEEKLVDRIRKWEDRGKLDVFGHVRQFGKDRSLYRLGDIQALLVRHAQKEQERRLQQPA